MTAPRSQIVNLEETRYFHCISRCVRGARLCGSECEHRKEWLENRVEELAGIFAMSIGSFAVLDSHFHLVLRLDGKETVDKWSDKEVAERWGRIYPPRGKNRKPIPVSEEWIKERCADDEWITRMRGRMANLGWFMKCLKEPLSRMANRQDGCRGAFWESRYKSIAVLDDMALLATCVYSDLNVFAAGLCDLPENSPHTSLKVRMENCLNRKRAAGLDSALTLVGRGEVVSDERAAELEEGLWLCPLSSAVENRFGAKGMLEGLSLAHYLELVESTSRLAREGKNRLSETAPTLLERLGTTVETWEKTISRLFGRTRPLGVAFSFSRSRLREAAARRGCHHLANLNGCLA